MNCRINLTQYINFTDQGGGELRAKPHSPTRLPPPDYASVETWIGIKGEIDLGERNLMK